MWLFAITVTCSSESPLPRGEGARSAGEGQKPKSFVARPSPGLRPPSPRGKGPSLWRVIAIANDKAPSEPESLLQDLDVRCESSAVAVFRDIVDDRSRISFSDFSANAGRHPE